MAPLVFCRIRRLVPPSLSLSLAPSLSLSLPPLALFELECQLFSSDSAVYARRACGQKERPSSHGSLMTFFLLYVIYVMCILQRLTFTRHNLFWFVCFHRCRSLSICQSEVCVLFCCFSLSISFHVPIATLSWTFLSRLLGFRTKGAPMWHCSKVANKVQCNILKMAMEGERERERSWKLPRYIQKCQHLSCFGPFVLAQPRDVTVPRCAPRASNPWGLPGAARLCDLWALPFTDRKSWRTTGGPPVGRRRRRIIWEYLVLWTLINREAAGWSGLKLPTHATLVCSIWIVWVVSCTWEGPKSCKSDQTKAYNCKHQMVYTKFSSLWTFWTHRVQVSGGQGWRTCLDHFRYAPWSVAWNSTRAFPDRKLAINDVKSLFLFTHITPLHFSYIIFPLIPNTPNTEPHYMNRSNTKLCVSLCGGISYD